ncbi:MAG: hypothetical protein KatS3mg031_0334 [Chitinophagales bacterium]|nr:MAG: hypothetical protein KatS3mg031_0334 [Chitinophagales bacterium]
MNTLNNPAALSELLERINRLQPSSQPLWGKMTVHEMICHVSDPFRDVLKIRNIQPVTPFFLRPLLKWILLNKKPFGKNAPTVKPYLQSHKGGGTKPKNFENDKTALKDLVIKFSELDDHFVLGPHAALGKLSRDQAGLLMWKHLDHHLRQFGL